jgi:prevent-host-death family protein
MKIVNSTDLRQKLSAYLELASSESDDICISRPGGEAVLLISKRKYDALSNKSGGELYGLTRLQILHMSATTQDLVDIPYAYAWSKGIYPLLNDSTPGHLKSSHEFCADDFIISKRVVENIIDYLDECCDKPEGSTLTFYDLEDHFNSRSASSYEFDRVSLLLTCRYAYLSDMFDEQFWTQLLEPMKHPSEARMITRDWEPSELIL